MKKLFPIAPIKTASLALLVAFPILFQSCCCFFDDLSNCSKNRVVFSYLADASSEVLPKYIESIDYYLYDGETDKLLETYHLDKQNIAAAEGELPGINLKLTTGKTYRTVAIGNVAGLTKLENTNNYSQATMGEPNGYQVAKTLMGNDRLYLGQKEITGAQGTNTVIDTVAFSSAHVRFHFRVLHAPDEVFGKTKPYTIRLTAMAPLTNTSNGVCHTDVRNLELLPIEGKIKAKVNNKETELRVFQGDMNSLRFENSTPSRIQLVYNPTGTMLCDASLADFLTSYNLQVSGKNEVDLYISFAYKGLVVTVAPWVENPATPIVQ